MPAVFYRLRRAAAYAGHAVGAAIAPNGPSAIDADVLRRAQSGALSAADAGVACAEFLGLDKHRVKRAVYDAAAYSVCELYRRLCKAFAAFYVGRYAVDRAVCAHDDLGLILRRGGFEHDDVVFRHNDLGAALKDKAFAPAPFFNVASGVADLAAAGHDKVYIPTAAQLGFVKPVAHDARNAPGVGRRDDDPRLLRFKRRGVVIAQPFKKIRGLVADGVCNAPCSIGAVAGSGVV